MHVGEKAAMTTVQVGDGGEVTIPLELRRAVGIGDRSFVRVEKVGDGILLRPAGPDVEIYTPERKAEFLLSNAVDDADYAAAVREVRAMGLDPDTIEHLRPSAT
jgi:bifunctional DNA-binding transcriptional regulator/antitoxin component of YhaV-PrlF toxin-antitoxin module